MVVATGRALTAAGWAKCAGSRLFPPIDVIRITLRVTPQHTIGRPLAFAGRSARGADFLCGAILSSGIEKPLLLISASAIPVHPLSRHRRLKLKIWIRALAGLAADGFIAQRRRQMAHCSSRMGPRERTVAGSRASSSPLRGGCHKLASLLAMTRTQAVVSRD
jgi:hypothetical protein